MYLILNTFHVILAACRNIVAYVGKSIKPRSHTLTDQAGSTVRYGFIIPGQMVPFDGYVIKWKYWASSSTHFNVTVWRPSLTGSTDVVFGIVGINEVLTLFSNQTVVYNVPEHDVIEVRRGDVIGAQSEDGIPQIAWSNEGEDSCNRPDQIRWYQLPLSSAPQFMADVELCMSFQAVVKSNGEPFKIELH